jgi:hypothetical protein
MTFDLIIVGADGVTFANHQASLTIPRPAIRCLYRQSDLTAELAYISGGDGATTYVFLRCDDPARAASSFSESLSNLEDLIRGKRVP